MKRHLWLAVIVLLCGTLLVLPAMQSSTAKLPPAPASSSKPAPGVEAAQALSTITGVAISPLLGVGTVGAWRYFKTPSERRDTLPWFAQPCFWVPALLICAMVFLKDALGPAVPTVLKKPFDVAEVFENKLSGLVATGAFVPLVATIFHSAGEEGRLAALGVATLDASTIYNLLITPVAMAAFVIVWLAGHAINVLILISPFGTLDALLKAFRLFLLSTVVGTSFLNPYVGAAWALVILAVSYFIAGWTVRMTIFGSVFAWDWITLRRRRFKPAPDANWVFTARKIERVPVRTYGKLMRDEQGRLVLRYRPWLVFPERVLVLPEGRYVVGRGLFYPEIRRQEGDDARAQITLPPRYRTHEDEVAHVYGLGAVVDIGVLAGIKGLWRWLKGLFGVREKAMAA